MNYTETITLTHMTCGECGIIFGVPEDWYNEKRHDGNGFYCPNGHPRIFREPTVKRLERELAKTQTELRSAKCEILREKQCREAAEAKTVKLSARVKNGVCPCCHRSFTNLRRHMSTKHPNQSV